MPDLIIADSVFLNRLRSQTAELHERLEQLPLSLLLTSPQLTLKDYIYYLQMMYAVNIDAEKNIYSMLHKVITDIEVRKKSHYIKEDIAFLNSDMQAITFSFLQPLSECSIAFALGIMYVLEGSTLGGRFILKNVEKILQLNEQKGASYFAGYRSSTSEKWKSFINAMVDYQSKTNNDATIIDGAKHAFNSIYNLMKQVVI